jgi:hypothetical protein
MLAGLKVDDKLELNVTEVHSSFGHSTEGTQVSELLQKKKKNKFVDTHDF